MVDAVGCPFCNPEPERVFWEGSVTFALWDRYPVNPGHALIVPRRHLESWFDATEQEQTEILMGLKEARARISAESAPDGYNVGINDGSAAGQTVRHLHVHLIPRYRGDVDDPRGGIRWVVPKRAAYWRDDGSR